MESYKQKLRQIYPNIRIRSEEDAKELLSSLEHDAKRAQQALKRVETEPPWVAAPTIVRGDMAWQMGGWSTYILSYERWFRSLSHDSRAAHIDRFPEPNGWKGYYKEISV